jgi:hypothetical protein
MPFTSIRKSEFNFERIRFVWQRHKTRLQQAVERSDEWFETTLAGFVLTVLIVALFLFGLAFGLPAALEVYIR